jgi:hypothetical protein
MNKMKAMIFPVNGGRRRRREAKEKQKKNVTK